MKDAVKCTIKGIKEAKMMRLFFAFCLLQNYDKDNFPYDNFDNTQFSVEKRKGSKIRVAWSNERIELWYLLHFQEYVSNNGSEQYIKKLKGYFEYAKSKEDLYDVIIRKGSLEDVKRRAKR